LTKFRIYIHRSSMIGVRTRVQDSCESGLCPICIADCPVFCEVSKSALRGHVDLYPIREYFGDYTARLEGIHIFFCKDFRIQFKFKGVEMLN